MFNNNGNTNTPSSFTFGTINPSTQPAFGFRPTGNSTVFGSRQASSPVFGTPIPFKPVIMNSDTITISADGIPFDVRIRLQCISHMKEYEKKSFEELRFEDYQVNRKGTFGAHCGTPFGTPAGSNQITQPVDYFSNILTPSAAGRNGFGLFGSRGDISDTIYGATNRTPSIQNSNFLPAVPMLQSQFSGYNNTAAYPATGTPNQYYHQQFPFSATAAPTVPGSGFNSTTAFSNSTPNQYYHQQFPFSATAAPTVPGSGFNSTTAFSNSTPNQYYHQQFPFSTTNTIPGGGAFSHHLQQTPSTATFLNTPIPRFQAPSFNFGGVSLLETWKPASAYGEIPHSNFQKPTSAPNPPGSLGQLGSLGQHGSPFGALDSASGSGIGFNRLGSSTPLTGFTFGFRSNVPTSNSLRLPTEAWPAREQVNDLYVQNRTAIPFELFGRADNVLPAEKESGIPRKSTVKLRELNCELKLQCNEQVAELVSYDEESGDWTFRVKQATEDESEKEEGDAPSEKAFLLTVTVANEDKDPKV